MISMISMISMNPMISMISKTPQSYFDKFGALRILLALFFKNIGPFPKNVGDFPKNVGLFLRKSDYKNDSFLKR